MREVNRRARRRLVLPLMIAMVAAGTLAGAGPALAGQPLLTTFFYDINETCLRGQAIPNVNLKVTLRSADGTLQGQFKRSTGGGGDWAGCFWDEINPGDRITATDGSTSRTITVPKVQYTINRANDVVSGKSVANSHVLIVVWGCQDFWWDCSEVAGANVATNGKGKFSRDFTNTYDIRGGDEIEVRWTSVQGDQVSRWIDAPYFGVGLHSPQAWGQGKPSGQVTMWLFNAQGNQRSKFRTRAHQQDGDFSGRFKNGAIPRFNDYVGSDIASDALWKIPNVNPQFDTSADTINAKCFKNTGFYLYVEHVDGTNWMDLTGIANGNGNISINTMTQVGFDLLSEDTVALSCRHPLGDELLALFTVP